MRKLNAFNFLTLNGFFEGLNHDISWHRHGAEESKYSDDSLQVGNILLFGRRTYEMMYSFWPTQLAAEQFPKTAKGMNRSQKIIFSNTIKKAEWNNTQVISGNIVEEMRRLKKSNGKDMTILGSGSIVSQFANAGLIDIYQIMIDPVAIGEGTNLFQGLKNKLNLKLTKSKIFKSGVVLLCYKPLKN